MQTPKAYNDHISTLSPVIAASYSPIATSDLLTLNNTISYPLMSTCEDNLSDEIRKLKSEVIFVFAVEAKEDDTKFIPIIESELLDEVANAVLFCMKDVLRRLSSPSEHQYIVSAVEFPASNAIISTKPCNPTRVGSLDCNIISTRVIITHDDAEINKIRFDVLLAIKESLEDETYFTELISGLNAIRYIGPDLFDASHDSQILSNMSASDSLLFTVTTTALLLGSLSILLFAAALIRCFSVRNCRRGPEYSQI